MNAVAESPRIEKLQARVMADAMDEMAHFLLGKEYIAEGRYMESVAEMRRCVELNPDYVAAWRGLGEACARTGIHKEAAAAYRTGINVAERTSDARSVREIRELLNTLPEEYRAA